VLCWASGSDRDRPLQRWPPTSSGRRSSRRSAHGASSAPPRPGPPRSPSRRRSRSSWSPASALSPAPAAARAGAGTAPAPRRRTPWSSPSWPPLATRAPVRRLYLPIDRCHGCHAAASFASCALRGRRKAWLQCAWTGARRGTTCRRAPAPGRAAGSSISRAEAGATPCAAAPAAG
jgi:hypothetical protein